MIGRKIPAGDLATKQRGLISGPEYAVQQIRQKLRLLKGEWFWDTNAGMPYFQRILVKGPNEALIQSIYRSKILEVPGIVTVVQVSLEIDPASRLLTVDFAAIFHDESTNAKTRIEGTA